MIGRRVIQTLLALLLLFAAAACQSETGTEESTDAAPVSEARSTSEDVQEDPAAVRVETSDESNVADEADGGSAVAPAAALTDDYADALSIQGQLALGTIQLEETALAVGVEQAEALLPLWQALSTLSSSDTTADAELEAVVRQIERTMTPDQVAAIAGMRLTVTGMQALQESGELVLGGFGARAGGGMGEEGEVPAGGGPGLGGGPGGGRGGGMGGGPGALPGGEIDEDVLATRQAQFASGDISLEDTMLVAAVTRLLRVITGEAATPGGTINLVWTTIADILDVDVETLQGEFAAGATPAEIIAGYGGDLEDIRTAILDALAETTLAAEGNAEQFVDDFLSGDR